MHFESFGVSIDGNIITYHDIPAHAIGAKVLKTDQATITKTGSNAYDVSMPMNRFHHEEYRGLIHRANSENLLDKSNRKGDDKPDGDGPPNNGGTPGASRVVEFENTFAIAA